MWLKLREMWRKFRGMWLKPKKTDADNAVVKPGRKKTDGDNADADYAVVKTGWVTAGALVIPQFILGLAAGKSDWSTAFLWSMGSVAVGGLLGFLFGVPKVLQDETTKTTVYRQVVNTNLDQISDWLTKIVVGLTLVNAREISKSLQGTAGILAKALGDTPSAYALALATLVYFPVIGFMSVYILTRLFLGRAFREGERDRLLENVGKSIRDASQAKSWEEARPHLDKALNQLPSRDRAGSSPQ